MSGRFIAGPLSAAVLALTPAAALASGGVKHAPTARPTRAQIRAAVARAKHSPNLWATINICDTNRYRRTIGIRGQMPALGFATRMSMQFEIEYWSTTDQRYEPDPNAIAQINLRRHAYGLQQGGVAFAFAPPQRLRALVTFEWKLGTRVVAQLTRQTTGGHRGVDFSDPTGYSASSCSIS
jgi:hypothetical protein